MRILVVDDEPAIRHLIDRYLTRQGHNVFVAPSAGEANALVLDSWQPFDAAVLDIRLPGIDGVACGELLRGLFPGIRVIFISGSTLADTSSCRRPPAR
jgi:DNA-binding response OmpR family regulator